MKLSGAPAKHQAVRPFRSCCEVDYPGLVSQTIYGAGYLEHSIAPKTNSICGIATQNKIILWTSSFGRFRVRSENEHVLVYDKIWLKQQPDSDKDP